MTPEDLAALLQSEGSGLSPDEYDEQTESPEARQRRTQLLLPVLSDCQQAWATGSQDLDFMAEKLGDGSRDVAWRGPIGDSGILDLFLGCLAHETLRQGFYIHALRLIGNSCADTDENRARVVQGNHITSIIRLLQDQSLIPFTIPVLFNILVDYEPAQKQASQNYLNQHLTALLSSASLTNFSAFIPYFCKILGLLITQDCEPALANPNTVPILLTLATASPCQDDLDDFVSLVTVVAAYLANETFQDALVTGPHVPLLLSAYATACSRFDAEQVDDAETAEQLRRLQTGLLTTLTDITSKDAFVALYPLNSGVVQTLWAWLHSSNYLLQTAACLSLGNISRSDETSTSLVQLHNAHKPLSLLISDPSTRDPQLLHSALSFLKNLAIPVQNKELLGDLLEPPCLPRIYALDSLPQIQFAAASLTRLLLLNCPSNVRRFCSPLSSDPASSSRERTSLHVLLELFERSDTEPTKMEIARATAAVCRVLHTYPSSQTLPEWGSPDIFQPKTVPSPTNETTPIPLTETDDRARAHLYGTLRLHRALGTLVQQQKWPTVRSESLFVFALMCRSREGARVIVRLQHDVAVLEAFYKIITGRNKMAGLEGAQTGSGGGPEQGMLQSSGLGNTGGMPDAGAAASVADGLGLEPQEVDPQQSAQMARIDRENCLVMCTELLKNWTPPPLRQGLFEDMVREGTELVAADKAR